MDGNGRSGDGDDVDAVDGGLLWHIVAYCGSPRARSDDGQLVPSLYCHVEGCICRLSMSAVGRSAVGGASASDHEHPSPTLTVDHHRTSTTVHRTPINP
jgi:hypothetical protein